MQPTASRPLTAIGLAFCAVLMLLTLTSNDWVSALGIGTNAQGGLLGIDRCQGFDACTRAPWTSLEHPGWIPALAIALIVIGSAATAGTAACAGLLFARRRSGLLLAATRILLATAIVIASWFTAALGTARLGWVVHVGASPIVAILAMVIAAVVVHRLAALTRLPMAYGFEHVRLSRAPADAATVSAVTSARRRRPSRRSPRRTAA